jgi:hypothetical protein
MPRSLRALVSHDAELVKTGSLDAYHGVDQVVLRAFNLDLCQRLERQHLHAPCQGLGSRGQHE